MEILELSESTPRSESRLKSQFWPSIDSGADVDYLGTQGYWVCTAVAVISFGALALRGQFEIAAVVSTGSRGARAGRQSNLVLPRTYVLS
jgi:hypothetical protein